MARFKITEDQLSITWNLKDIKESIKDHATEKQARVFLGGHGYDLARGIEMAARKEILDISENCGYSFFKNLNLDK